MIFLMQFGINKHTNCNFLQSLKFARAYLFQAAFVMIDYPYK